MFNRFEDTKSNPQLNKMLVGASLLLLAALYQNFDVVDLFHLPLQQVDQGIRTAHARQLLGKGYDSSPAATAENMENLNISIFNRVYENLPKKYRSQASDISQTIIDEAQKHDFDPVFVMAVIRTESHWNPLAKGSVGEIGLMQLRPETAEWIAKKAKLPWYGTKTLENPVLNVKLGVAYLDFLRGSFDGYANKYLSAYNMGAGNVRRMYKNDMRPKEYSTKVMQHYKELYTRLVRAHFAAQVAGN